MCIECRCAEHGAPVGRSPPRSTTRKRNVRREGGQKRSRLGEYFAAGPSGPAVLSRSTRARARARSSTLCEKKTSQFATCSLSDALTPPTGVPSVRLAPSTEHRRLKVSPSGSRFGGGQSENRTKVSPARCISLLFLPAARCSANAEHRARRSLKAAASRPLSRVRTASRRQEGRSPRLLPAARCSANAEHRARRSPKAAASRPLSRVRTASIRQEELAPSPFVNLRNLREVRSEARLTQGPSPA